MAKIDVHLGFTFKVGNANSNQYSRVDVTIGDVDSDLPIEEQLDKSKETIDKVWEEVRSQVDSKVDQILDETSS
jgi:adenylosuccinate synthase